MAVAVAVGSSGVAVWVEDGVGEGSVAVAVDDGVFVGVLLGRAAMESGCDPLNAAAVAQAARNIAAMMNPGTCTPGKCDK